MTKARNQLIAQAGYAICRQHGILITILLLLCFFTLDSSGQSRRERVRERVDSVLTAKYQKTNFDTTYLSRPQSRLTLKFRTNISGSYFNIDNTVSGNEGRSQLRTAHKATFSIGASYRGISAGLSLNPGSLSGRNKDFEINVNAYSNRYGVDVVYQDSRTLSGTTSFNGSDVFLERGMADMKMLIVDGYYAFNGRRFSYPAAFTQSFIQKRSAGSWLVGFSYLGGRIKTTEEKPVDTPELRFYVGHFAIGGGYAYNLVIGRKWLLHLSAIPTVVVVNRNNIKVNGERYKMDTQFPVVISTERSSLVYQFSNKYFAGATFVMTNYFLGSSRVDINYKKWRLRAFLGIRL